MKIKKRSVVIFNKEEQEMIDRVYSMLDDIYTEMCSDNCENIRFIDCENDVIAGYSFEELGNTIDFLDNLTAYEVEVE